MKMAPLLCTCEVLITLIGDSKMSIKHLAPSKMKINKTNSEACTVHDEQVCQVLSGYSKQLQASSIELSETVNFVYKTSEQLRWHKSKIIKKRKNKCYWAWRRLKYQGRNVSRFLSGWRWRRIVENNCYCSCCYTCISAAELQELPSPFLQCNQPYHWSEKPAFSCDGWIVWSHWSFPMATLSTWSFKGVTKRPSNQAVTMWVLSCLFSRGTTAT